MEAALKRALVAVCLFLGACDRAEQRLECSDPNLTSECRGLLKACGADAVTHTQTVLTTNAAQRMTTCLQGAYAARCNSICQVAE
jgi:hypothetical protein